MRPPSTKFLPRFLCIPQDFHGKKSITILKLRFFFRSQSISSSTCQLSDGSRSFLFPFLIDSSKDGEKVGLWSSFRREMESLIAGSALGAAFEVLFDTVLGEAKRVVRFDSDFARLKSTLYSIKPAIDDIERFNKILDRPPEETKRFTGRLQKGVVLVRKCSKVKLNVCKRLYYSRKLSSLEAELVRFFQIEVGALNFRETKKISVGVSKLDEKVNEIATKLKNSEIGGDASSEFVGWCSVPGAPDFVVGMEQPVRELTKMLLEDPQNVVVLSAPGGCGKTTLAKKICHEEKIKGLFGDNIFFVTVSRSAKIDAIVQKIFQTVNQRVLSFHSDEDAINQLEQLFLRHIGRPVLLVLDDVWSSSSGEDALIEKLILNLPSYKILVTSRYVLPRFSTYRLKPLSYEQSVELFRQSAFENGICTVSTDLVDKVIKLCGGFPIALKVVGRSLYKHREIIWKSRINKWSNGESIFTTSNDLLGCLKLSLVALDEMPKLKECYLDLGLFSEDQKIPVDALLDMWKELYNLDIEDALVFLYELSNRNLIDLTRDRMEADEDTEYCNEQFVTQHDLLRELSIYQIGQEPTEYQRRVILEVKKKDFLNWSINLKQESIFARKMSISTDEMTTSDWYDMQVPGVEVFILNFSARLFSLPPFMGRMQQLKVLILTNNGSCPAELSNFPAPDLFLNLKTIRLEHISISSTGAAFLQLRNLRKLSLVMCEICKALENCYIWPNLEEINIDYCNDLVELPFWFCQLSHLKKLTISHCPELVKLPEELGNLTNLEVLRLHSCTALQELPDSIGRLHKLRFLDLSDCVGMENLPVQMGILRSLRKLDMRGCWGLSELPPSLLNLVQLEHVICDEEIACLWGYHNDRWSNLKISIIKEDKNLHWLHNFCA